MWTVKELLVFLQSNNKRGALLYVNYMYKQKYGINIIRYLDSENIALCYDANYRSISPLKVKDAISQLQHFNENSTIYYHHITSSDITKYGIIKNIWDVDNDNIFLLINKL